MNQFIYPTITKFYVKEFTPLWVRRTSTIFNHSFRMSRKRLNSEVTQCFICEVDFIDGEEIALAKFKKLFCKFICIVCAEDLINSRILKQVETT